MLKTRLSRLICLGQARRLTQGGEVGQPAEDEFTPYP